MPPPARPAGPEADLNFAPRFRPFYAQEVAGYERELDKLVLPGEFRALTEHPRLQLQACRLRAGGRVVSLESTPIAVQHRAEHAADLQHAEFLASFVIAGHGVIVQNEATLPLEPGDIIFRTTALPSEIRMYTDSRIVVVKGPLSRLLGAHSLAMSQFTAQRGVASLPLVQTAHRCLRHVFFDKTESNPVSSLFAEQALLALLASIYTSQALEKIPGDARAPADNWQVLASYIDAHITDPELSVQAVADVLRVTTRWVHRCSRRARCNTPATCASAACSWLGRRWRIHGALTSKSRKSPRPAVSCMRAISSAAFMNASVCRPPCTASRPAAAARSRALSVSRGAGPAAWVS